MCRLEPARSGLACNASRRAFSPASCRRSTSLTASAARCRSITCGAVTDFMRYMSANLCCLEYIVRRGGATHATLDSFWRREVCTNASDKFRAAGSL